MVDYVEAEVEQRLVLDVAALQKRTNIELQLVEHFLVDDTIAIYEVAEQQILVNSLLMLVAHFDRACARLVCLNFIHILFYFEL